MKKFLVSTAIAFSSMMMIGQAQTTTNIVKETGQYLEPATYRLFPTSNIWNLVKLNTRNGQMWQVQFDTKDETRFEVVLSTMTRVYPNEEKDGRFTLCQTQNLHTFILLDQIDGRTWQVQWSVKPEERFVIPISK